MPSEDVEISRGIVVNPARMGGTPCIVGTRVPARLVGSLADDGVDADAIIDEYYPTVTRDDVINARWWWRREVHRGSEYA
jgi:uncharacterized protein (DUF433 family)